jgi:hypothetical protein
MAKRMTVEQNYSEGRHRPSAQPRDQHRNQDVEDRHSSNYDNDCRGWVRGARGTVDCYNEDATGKPGGFDKQNAWRLGREGIEHGPGDPATIRKPESNK